MPRGRLLERSGDLVLVESRGTSDVPVEEPWRSIASSSCHPLTVSLWQLDPLRIFGTRGTCAERLLSLDCPCLSRHSEMKAIGAGIPTRLGADIFVVKSELRSEMFGHRVL